MQYSCLVKWSITVFLASISLGHALPSPGPEVAKREETQSENVDLKRQATSRPINMCPPGTNFGASSCDRQIGPKAYIMACNAAGHIEFPGGACGETEICVDTVNPQGQLAYCVSTENFVKFAYNQVNSPYKSGDTVDVLPQSHAALPINTVLQAVTVVPNESAGIIDASLLVETMNCANSGLSQYYACSSVYPLADCTECNETPTMKVPPNTNQISVTVNNPEPFELYVGWLSP